MSPKSQGLIKGMDQRKDEPSQDIPDKPNAAAHTARKPSEGLGGSKGSRFRIQNSNALHRSFQISQSHP